MLSSDEVEDARNGLAEKNFRLVKNPPEPPGECPGIISNLGCTLANAAPLKMLHRHLLMGLERFTLVGQHKFRPITDGFVAGFAVRIEKGNLDGMNMVHKETAQPMRIPTHRMKSAVKANWFGGKKRRRILQICLDIGA